MRDEKRADQIRVGVWILSKQPRCQVGNMGCRHARTAFVGEQAAHHKPTVCREFTKPAVGNQHVGAGASIHRPISPECDELGFDGSSDRVTMTGERRRLTASGDGDLSRIAGISLAIGRLVVPCKTPDGQ